jgi:beta-glucosidase
MAKNASKIIVFREKNYTETPGDISNLFINDAQIN